MTTTAFKLRYEALKDPEKAAEAILYEHWTFISNRYSLRVLGLRAQFYKITKKDQVHAKNMIPLLEDRGDMTMYKNIDSVLWVS